MSSKKSKTSTKKSAEEYCTLLDKVGSKYPFVLPLFTRACLTSVLSGKKTLVLPPDSVLKSLDKLGETDLQETLAGHILSRRFTLKELKDLKGTEILTIKGGRFTVGVKGDKVTLNDVELSDGGISTERGVLLHCASPLKPAAPKVLGGGDLDSISPEEAAEYLANLSGGKKKSKKSKNSKKSKKVGGANADGSCGFAATGGKKSKKSKTVKKSKKSKKSKKNKRLGGGLFMGDLPVIASSEALIEIIRAQFIASQLSADSYYNFKTAALPSLLVFLESQIPKFSTLYADLLCVQPEACFDLLLGQNLTVMSADFQPSGYSLNFVPPALLLQGFPSALSFDPLVMLGGMSIKFNGGMRDRMRGGEYLNILGNKIPVGQKVQNVSGFDVVSYAPEEVQQQVITATASANSSAKDVTSIAELTEFYKRIAEVTVSRNGDSETFTLYSKVAGKNGYLNHLVRDLQAYISTVCGDFKSDTDGTDSPLSRLNKVAAERCDQISKEVIREVVEYTLKGKSISEQSAAYVRRFIRSNNPISIATVYCLM